MPLLRLTEKTIERLPFANETEIYFDTRLPGFGVRVGKRKKVYIVQGRANGKSFKRSLGRVDVEDYEQVRTRAEGILKAATKGIMPGSASELLESQQPKAITLRNCLPDYCVIRKKMKDRTREEYAEVLVRHVDDWLDRPMEQITPAEALQRHGSIKSKAQADYCFRIIRALYNYAMEIHDETITRNPVKRLSTLKAWHRVKRRQTFVPPSSLPEFFAATGKNPELGLVADYLTVLLFTGIRSKSEIARLAVEHVDFKERAIKLYDTKNHEDLYVPVNASALAALERRAKDAHRLGCPYLFYAFESQPARFGHIKPLVVKGEFKPMAGDLRNTIKNMFAGTMLEKLTPHDLRRTFLTYADELLISNVVQKRLVGHAIPQDVTDGYKVLTMDRLRKEVTRIERFILKHKKG